MEVKNILYLIINPKNKIYKTFKKRGFLDRETSIEVEVSCVPRIGEKIHLTCYNSTNMKEELKNFIGNRNKPIVFIIEDIIHDTYGNGTYNNRKINILYVKVSEVEDYKCYSY